MKYFLLGAFLTVSLSTLAAQQYDYQWPFGYGNNFSLDFGVSLLDFTESQIRLNTYAEVSQFELGNFGSFVCNRQGELVLMTNNCEVVDHQFQTVPGSEVLTPGPGHDNTCEYGYYTADQTTLFLPDFNKDSIYYLLHKDVVVSAALQDVLAQHWYASQIVEKQDGSFYLKDKQLLIQEDLGWGRMTGVAHADGERWWGLTLGYNNNRIYTVLLGGDELVEGPFQQEIGLPLINQELDIGQIAFSPGGQLLGINNERHGIMLYDFDPATGQLSNFRSIAYPNMEGAEGLAFSPDGRFVYVCTAEDLYQVEWAIADQEEAIVHLGQVTGIDKTNWPYALGQIYMGPDCRLYISPGSTTYYIHVVHSPNEKGLACDLEPSALRSPTNLNFDFPNIPMYHNGMDCADIPWPFTSSSNSVAEEQRIQVFPNPVKDHLQIAIPNHPDNNWTFELLDVLGRSVFRKAIAGSTTLSVSLEHVDAGVYYYRLLSDDKEQLDIGTIVVE